MSPGPQAATLHERVNSPRVAPEAQDARGAGRRQYVAMILEQANLDVIPGRESAFETAFEQARLIISAMPGFRSLRLSRCIERPNRYLLLVEWERLEDHTEGFRGSPQYQEWRALLHQFYDPFPVVEHYEDVEAR
jgi:heme-degrading monooxygenase HmoA